MDDLTWDLDEDQPKKEPTAAPPAQPDIAASTQTAVSPFSSTASHSPPNPSLSNSLVQKDVSALGHMPPAHVVPQLIHPPLVAAITPSGTVDFKKAFLDLVGMQDRQMRFAGVRLGERALAEKIYQQLFIQSGYTFGLDAPSAQTLAYLLARVYLRFLYSKEDISASAAFFERALQEEAAKLNIRLNTAPAVEPTLRPTAVAPIQSIPLSPPPVSLPDRSVPLDLPLEEELLREVPLEQQYTPPPVIDPPKEATSTANRSASDRALKPVHMVSKPQDPNTYVYETDSKSPTSGVTRPQRPYLDLDQALEAMRPQLLKEAATRNGSVSLGYGLEYRVDSRGFIDFYKNGKPLEIYSLRLNPQGQIMTEETIRSLTQRLDQLPLELRLVLQEFDKKEEVIQAGFKEALFEQMKLRMIFKVSFGDQFELRVDPPLEVQAKPVARLINHGFWEDGRDPWPLEFNDDYVLFNTGQRIKYSRYRDRIVLENWRILDPQKLTGEVRLDGSIHFHHIRPNFVGLLDLLYSYYRSSELSQKGWDFRFTQSNNIGLLAGEKQRLIEEDLVIIGPSEKVITTLSLPNLRARY